MSAHAVEESGVISIAGLARRFGLVQAVHPLSVRIGPGGITGLLGPNGSGKSTLLRMLIGLVRPDAGEAAVDGARLAGDGLAIRQRVAYLCGEIHVYGELSGRSHLAWLLRARPSTALRRALDIAKRFELPLAKPVRSYSHGMKRQLFLAAALAPEVRVRILDEPTEGLDPTRRREVLELLREDAARGTTLLFSSHHLGEVARTCERQLFLRRGELLDEGAATGLRERARLALRVTWTAAPDPGELARVLEPLGALESRVDGPRATFFFPGGEADGRAALLLLLQASALGDPRTIEYGEPSLSDLYRELYGVEGV